MSESANDLHPTISQKAPKTISFGAIHASGNSHVSNIGELNAQNVYMGDRVSVPENPSTIPRSVNRLFCGREDVLQKVKSAFLNNINGENNVERRFVIAGLGGTGKSEICLKYIQDNRSEYWGAFWVDCSSSATILESFRRIGSLCGLSTPDIAYVKDYLSSIDKHWIMVFDNADGYKYDYSTYFPSARKNDIIITTRNPELSSKYGQLGSEHLDQLPPEQAVHLLLRASNIPETEWLAKTNTANIVVRELGRHTLAILHAGSFISNTCKIEEYVELIRERKDLLFENKRDQEPATYDTIYHTFEISAKRMEDLKANGDVAAGDALGLLGRLAFFANEVPLEDIAIRATRFISLIQSDEIESERESRPLHKRFSKLFAKWRDKEEPLSSVLFSRDNITKPSPYVPDDEASIERRIRWRAALNILTVYSFVTVIKLKGKLTITMHPLVHAWAYNRLDSSARNDAFFEVTSLIALSVQADRSDDQISWNIQTQIHASFGHSIEPEPSLELLPILFTLSLALIGQFENSEALRLIELSIRIINRNKPFAKRMSSILDRFELFRLYCVSQIGDCWDISEAVEEFELLMKRAKKVLKPDDELVELVASHLYRKSGQGEKAIAQWERVVRYLEDENTEEEDGHLLTSQTELAHAYTENDQAERGIALFEHVVQTKEKKYGEMHSRVLLEQVVLAQLYLKHKQVEKAISLTEYLGKLPKEIYEEEVILNDSQAVLGTCYYLKERYNDAIPLLEGVTRFQDGRIKYDTQLSRLQCLQDSYASIGDHEKEKAVTIRIEQLEEAQLVTG